MQFPEYFTGVMLCEEDLSTFFKKSGLPSYLLHHPKRCWWIVGKCHEFLIPRLGIRISLSGWMAATCPMKCGFVPLAEDSAAQETGDVIGSISSGRNSKTPLVISVEFLKEKQIFVSPWSLITILQMTGDASINRVPPSLHLMISKYPPHYLDPC